MFSSRLPWSLRPNRLSVLLEGKRASGAPVLDLTESNPTRAALNYSAGQILGSLADPRSLLYEPSPAGLPGARQAVASYYGARGIGVDVSRIVLATSTSESYGYLFKLLADPGDEVLVPRPSYPLFDFLAALESVKLVQYPLAYHGGWSIDRPALEHAVTARTRAVILVNPNNPTGSYLKRDELQWLSRLCGERGIALICDEVFSDYPLRPDASRAATVAGHDGIFAFSMSGLSKIAGLPQLKLGWIVVSGPLELRNQALERLELIADTYLSAGTPVQHALARLLAAGANVQEQIAVRTARNLDALRRALRPDSPCEVLDVEGGWYATLRVPRTRSEEEWALELLARENVLVQPGFFYDFESEAYLVLSLLTPPEVFDEGVRRLLALAP